MGHDHHFLSRLDRVNREGVELALVFYREPELLRLAFASVEIPPDVDRVALSLDHHERGPFVIVSKEGRFITCLGEGMYLGNRIVIRRETLDISIEHSRVVKERIQAARKCGTHQEPEVIMRRLLSSGDTLTSEEVQALLFWKYIIVPDIIDFYKLSDGVLMELIQELTINQHDRITNIKLQRMPEAYLRSVWNGAWGQAHMFCLYAVEPAEDLIAHRLHYENRKDERRLLPHMGVRTGWSVTTLRALWVVATVGANLVPHYQELLRDAKDEECIFCSLFSLLAIGIRCPETSDGIRKFLINCRPIYAPLEVRWTQIVDLYRPLILESFKAPRTVQARFDQEARNFLNSSVLTEPLRRQHRTDLPIELVRRLYMQDMYGIILPKNARRAVAAICQVARLTRAEDHYLPKEIMDIVHPKWHRDRCLSLIDIGVKSQPQAASTKPEPLRSKPSPGPNDPCSCGKGKKFKRCCGMLTQKKSTEGLVLDDARLRFAPRRMCP